MKQKCEKCGAVLKNDNAVCPSCGTLNEKASAEGRKKRSVKAAVITLAVVFILLMVIGIIGGLSAPVRGYYEYEGKPYYYQNGVWYTYSQYYGWYGIVPDDSFTGNYKEYYKGNTYEANDSYGDFADSEYYLADGSVGSFNTSQSETDSGK